MPDICWWKAKAFLSWSLVWFLWCSVTSVRGLQLLAELLKRHSTSVFHPLQFHISPGTPLNPFSYSFKTLLVGWLYIHASASQLAWSYYLQTKGFFDFSAHLAFLLSLFLPLPFPIIFSKASVVFAHSKYWIILRQNSHFLLIIYIYTNGCRDRESPWFQDKSFLLPLTHPTVVFTVAQRLFPKGKTQSFIAGNTWATSLLWQQVLQVAAVEEAACEQESGYESEKTGIWIQLENSKLSTA